MEYMLVAGFFMALFVAGIYYGITPLMPGHQYLEMASKGVYFHPGDWAWCLNNKGYSDLIDKHKYYRVVDVIWGRERKNDQIAILDNLGQRRVFDATRFQMADEKRTEG